MLTMLRRLPTRALLAAVLLLGAACSDPLAPLPRTGPPTRLDFTFGGFAVDSRGVHAEGDSVLYLRRSYGGGPAIDSAWVVPTEAQWRAFWTTARAVGVERWRDEYVAEGIIDGNGWSLTIEAGGDTRRSTGANAYPDYLGYEHEGGMTDEFRYFVDALGALVGRDIRGEPAPLSFSRS